ncbi:unnamed protein product [Allacma fusca]|uniref:Uncharacterized protein n=1 Tax=Allacma fusca TaxID=39272 RepID=A0A8J2JYN1_9HEXA|nr:unnamed protein product [Allacma fusca]
MLIPESYIEQLKAFQFLDTKGKNKGSNKIGNQSSSRGKVRNMQSFPQTSHLALYFKSDTFKKSQNIQ